MKLVNLLEGARVLVLRVYSLCLLLALFLPKFSYGAQQQTESLSTFMSTRSSEVNLRKGPGKIYPVEWTIKKTGYPLKVIAKYGTWFKVIDVDGSGGWVHQGMLSKKKYAYVTRKSFIYKSADYNSGEIVGVDAKVCVMLKDVKRGWCKVKIESYEGWMKQDDLWGVS
jgi:SH3-like domain-containing protein